MRVKFFHRGCNVCCPRSNILLLAGQHTAIHAAFQHGLLHLERQQAQRRQINTTLGLCQTVQALVCLARIGSADMNDKPALHHTRFGILVLGIDRDEVGQLAANHGRDKVDQINLVQRAVHELTHREIGER